VDLRSQYAYSASKGRSRVVPFESDLAREFRPVLAPKPPTFCGPKAVLPRCAANFFSHLHLHSTYERKSRCNMKAIILYWW